MLNESTQIMPTTAITHAKEPLQSEKRQNIIALIFIALTLLIMNGIINNNEHLIQDLNIYGLNSSIITEVADPTKKYDSLHPYTVILRSSNPHMMILDGFTSTLRSYLTLSTYQIIC
eukprot:211835_1